jgi:hypothetical protein
MYIGFEKEVAMKRTVVQTALPSERRGRKPRSRTEWSDEFEGKP